MWGLKSQSKMRRWGWQSDNRQVLIYLFICMILMAISSASWRGPKVVEQAVTRSVSPFLHVATQGLKELSFLTRGIQNHFHTVEENQRLTNKLERFEKLWHAHLATLAENKQLKAQMHFQQAYTGEPMSARVIADSASPFAQSVLVHTPTAKAEKGQAALNEKGLVGRVVETFGDKARILLITDYNSRVPVRVVESKQSAIAKGMNGSFLELLVLEHEDAKITEGQKLVTSGMGDVFSANIPVGVVHKVIGNRVLVRPYVSTHQLDIITIKRRKIEGVVP